MPGLVEAIGNDGHKHRVRFDDGNHYRAMRELARLIVADVTDG